MIETYSLEIEARIIGLFIESDMPLNIQDITNKAEIHRITTRKHLNRLIHKGLIEEIEKPPMRLFRPIVTKDALKIFIETKIHPNIEEEKPKKV